MPARGTALPARNSHAPRDRELRRFLRATAADLGGQGGAGAAQLATALRLTTRRRVDAGARSWFDRIEGERARLLEDTTELSGGRGTTSTIGEVTRKASVPPHQAALLFHLARLTKATRCLELGTCVGVSGSYLGAAMALNGGGALRSLEGHADRAEVARRTFGRLGLEDAEVVMGRFQKTLDPTLATGPFDLAFVDGHHDGEATVAYTDQIRRASRPGAVLILDDIAWSDGMRAAWEHISTSLSASTTCDLRRVGLIVLGSADAGRG